MKNSCRLRIFDYIILAMLAFLLVCIFYFNFSRIISYYNFDMYSDILYATKAWEHRSVFPDGWVFGNQVYVAATPVLAALFYGITAEPLFSMGLASSVMALLVVFSFYWMIIPCFGEYTPRISACYLLVVFPLIFGDAVNLNNGWQMLYTMCSYYACYAITAFWAFGVYVRSVEHGRISNRFGLFLLCCFSFFMGIQSLRQTAIMALPMLVFEGSRMIHSLIRRRKLFGASFWVTLFLVASNLAGVIFSKIVPIESAPILGDIGLNTISAGALTEIYMSLLQLFRSEKRLIGFLVICLCGFGIRIYHLKKSGAQSGFALSGLMLLSVGAIVMIDLLLTMDVRFIYYFMVYPMVAYFTSCLLTFPLKWGKNLITAGFVCILAVVLMLGCKWGIGSPDLQKEYSYAEVSNYLTGSGYRTLFAETDLGSKIAVATDLEMKAGFWFKGEPFVEVRYLCDPGVYDCDPQNCVYVFQGSESVRVAQKKLDEHGLNMELMKYFSGSEIYVFTAEDPLIPLID